MSNQRRQKKKFESTNTTNSRNDVWNFDEIMKSRIDKRRNDSSIEQKDCLMYKAKWINYANMNITLKWYFYINFDKIQYVAVDYYHKHFNAKKSHFIFVRLNDWTSDVDWNSTNLERHARFTITNTVMSIQSNFRKLLKN